MSNILTLVHKQWTVQNVVVHACNDLSLKVHEGEELKIAIEMQFQLGTDGLSVVNHHLITRGQEVVEAMSALGQKTWLQSIQIACEVYEKERESETMQMRNAMYSWLNGA